MASHMSFASVAQCGRLPHEEKPEIVNRELLKFPGALEGLGSVLRKPHFFQQVLKLGLDAIHRYANNHC